MFASQFLSPFVSVLREASSRNYSPRRLSPFQIVALSFAVIIAIGGSLLLLPISQRTGARITPLDCYFTATSATCVTGLVTVSTADSWTRFGQTVILTLIQVGGLGYMTLATISAFLLGLRVGLRARLQLKETQGVLTLQDAIRVVRYTAIGTVIVEGIGATLLTLRFHYHHQMAWGEAAFNGIFYGISAFCNAGFDLVRGFTGLSLPTYRIDAFLLITIGFLIIFGGLGFGVLAELAGFQRLRRITLHAKLVVTVTGILIVVGWLLFMLFEANNPQTLGQLDPSSRLVTSWFMSVTPRTAGFSPIDLSLVTPPTLFLIGLLMIIGASPLSTGGGVKTTTLAIIFLAIIALVRKRPDIEVFRRRISGELVRLAISLVSVYLIAVLLVIIGISLTEIILKGLPPTAETALLYNRLVFEVLSAFGTVGLSAGITPTLEPASRILIMIGMYLGRLGPLAFVFVFAQPKHRLLRRLPSESIMTG